MEEVEREFELYASLIFAHNDQMERKCEVSSVGGLQWLHLFFVHFPFSRHSNPNSLQLLTELRSRAANVQNT